MASEAEIEAVARDNRPTKCRFRLQDEGKPYPRSSCTACGKSVLTGLGNRCTSALPLPVPAPSDEERAEQIVHDWELGRGPDHLAELITQALASVRAEATAAERERCAKFVDETSRAWRSQSPELLRPGTTVLPEGLAVLCDTIAAALRSSDTPHAGGDQRSEPSPSEGEGPR